MDWLHCNACFIQPRASSSSPKFFLTSCGHVYCERCNQTATNNKCRVCNAEYTTTQLSQELREDVRDFFADPATHLDKLCKVVKYQNSHRERLMGHLRRLIPKYESAKTEIQKMHEENKALRKKIHVQQQEIAWYRLQRDRARAARAVPSTPSTLPPSSPFGLPGLPPSSDTQRSALQHIRNSGLGNSRISMGFTASTPRRQEPASPLSMLPPASPSPSLFPGPYRSRQYATPESTPGAGHSFVSDSPGSSVYGLSSSQQTRRRHSPPSRGTPTDALKILSLAYQNANNKP